MNIEHSNRIVNGAIESEVVTKSTKMAASVERQMTTYNRPQVLRCGTYYYAQNFVYCLADRGCVRMQFAMTEDRENITNIQDEGMFGWATKYKLAKLEMFTSLVDSIASLGGASPLVISFTASFCSGFSSFV